MDATTNISTDTPAVPASNGGGALSIPTGNGKAKLRLLTRAALDGRTVAARLFDQLVNDIENDLGGKRQLTTIEQTLIEAYASAAITLQNLNTHLLLGHEVDFALHTQCVSAMVRVASRLGLQRRAADIQDLHGSSGLLEQIGARAAPAAIDMEQTNND